MWKMMGPAKRTRTDVVIVLVFRPLRCFFTGRSLAVSPSLLCPAKTSHLLVASGAVPDREGRLVTAIQQVYSQTACRIDIGDHRTSLLYRRGQSMYPIRQSDKQHLPPNNHL
jgi:hypothetical protein